MKELKDFIHLYLGCEAEVGFPKGKFICKIIGYFNNEYEVVTVLRDGGISKHQIEDVKPILRPLSDITEEEKIECVLLFDDQFILGQDGKYAWRATFFPSMFKYLLSKHFDLFGLIESGLAIDSKTLKEKI